jgi:hypothetical protein
MYCARRTSIDASGLHSSTSHPKRLDGEGERHTARAHDHEHGRNPLALAVVGEIWVARAAREGGEE